MTPGPPAALSPTPGPLRRSVRPAPRPTRRPPGNRLPSPVRLLRIARTAKSGSDLGHCGSLPRNDPGPGPPGSDDGCGVAQLDERVLAVEVAECLRVYGGAKSAVQMLGCGEQVLCLEHASAVA